MFRINHNVTSLISQRHLGRADVQTRRAVERLSSGLRIVRAADDAAGLMISEQMRAQVRGLQQANRNAQNAVSLIQTADGGMQQLSDMLIRLKELGITSADGSYTDTSRGAVQDEADAILKEIDRIANSTLFNGMSLLLGINFTFQVGDTGSTNSQIAVTLGPVTTGDLLPGVSSADFASQASAIAVIASIEQGIASLSKIRSRVGAAQNRLDHALQSIQSHVENLTNAESVIRDADFAAETASLTRALILVQSGTAVLGQANLLPQNALSLMQF